MPRNPRCILPGIAYHITQRGTNRQRVFFRNADHTAYLRLLGENLADAQVRLLAWCQMTNHVHLIAIPAHEDSLAILFRRTHGRYAQMINAQRNRSGHLWQNRYYGCPLSPTHLQRALAYVELNPVRAGLVRQPEQYQWSSAQTHLGLAPDRHRLLDLDFWHEHGGAPVWQALLATPEDPAESRQFRSCTYAGRPYGGADRADRADRGPTGPTGGRPGPTGADRGRPGADRGPTGTGRPGRPGQPDGLNPVRETNPKGTGCRSLENRRQRFYFDA